MMAPAPHQKKRFRSVSLIWLLPNMLTVAGLVSGLTALRFALDGRWEGTIGLIVLAAVFDALDGRTARRLKTSSAFGAALDSLCDMLFLVWYRRFAFTSGDEERLLHRRSCSRCCLPRYCADCR